MRSALRFPIALLLAMSLSGASLRAEEPLDFERDVRPLLSDRCFACHGPDGAHREAGLRLDVAEGSTATLDSGAIAIVPGEPSRSELVARIRSDDADLVMPPASLGRPLSENEKRTLERWIESGAEYATHWAFAPVEPHPLPDVNDPSAARGPIDRFLLQRLDRAGLEPAGEADRYQLLRRLTLTITGLPPSVEELRSFAADERPDAVERQVDRLLASPGYAERMALDWMDIARFADTLGYQIDGESRVWPWRDWVLRAMADDLPYDEFMTWQIAGDLLPNATGEQRLATAFNRLHRQTNEGGSIEQEFRQEYVSDRVHTFGTAFLGLTLECSRCHDHKYDPLPQSDYYSLCAMFGSIDESGLYPYGVPAGGSEPTMRLMEPADEAEAERRRQAYLAAREAEQRVLGERGGEPFEAWLASNVALSLSPPDERYPLDEIVDGRLPNALPYRTPASLSGGVPEAIDGAIGGAMRFDGDTVLALDGVSGLKRHQPLTVSMRLYSPERKQRSLIMHTGPGLYALASDASGFELLLEDGKLRWSAIFLWPGCCASIETRDDFPIGRWVDVTVTYDGSSRADGLRIYLDGRPVETNLLYDSLDKEIVADTMRLAARPRDDRGFAGGAIDEIRLFRSRLSAIEVAALHESTALGIASDEAPDAARGLFADRLERARRGDRNARDELREHFLERVDSPAIAARAATSAALRHLEDDFLHRFPTMMTMRQSPRPRPFYVLARGSYDAPILSQPVEPSAPEALLPFDPAWSRDRLGLARWLTDRRQPLVSRVAVNRIWMQCFGRGLVETQENFGSQGDPPSHPELLDDLAYRLMDEGWSQKRLMRSIVTSATFRRSSSVSPSLRQVDPDNRLLARGPTYRLSGEAIRDAALAASGLLVERVGGPSVKPWQPAGLWSEAGVSGGDYVPDTGAAAHRRSLYTYRKRTAPPPSLVTLDAGSREVCQPRRLATNTPLQPLVFLNDQGFFECARALAERAGRESDGSVDQAIELAFLAVTSRPADPYEHRTLRELFDEQSARFDADRAAATAVAGRDDPQAAAMTIVCSTLLASDAAITVR